MVASSTSFPEDPPSEVVVVYRKPAGSTTYDSSVSGTGDRHIQPISRYGFEAECCCGCRVASCLLVWAFFVLLTAFVCFSNVLSLYLFFTYNPFDPAEHPSQRRVSPNDENEDTHGRLYFLYDPANILMFVSATFSGFIVAISASLVLAATCQRNHRLLKVSLFFIIFTIGYFFLKGIWFGLLILRDDSASPAYKVGLILICSGSGWGPICFYIILIVIIKRALG